MPIEGVGVLGLFIFSDPNTKSGLWACPPGPFSIYTCFGIRHYVFFPCPKKSVLNSEGFLPDNHDLVYSFFTICICILNGCAGQGAKKKLDSLISENPTF